MNHRGTTNTVVIPAKAGIHVVFPPMTPNLLYGRLDPSFRWDDESGGNDDKRSPHAIGALHG